MDSFTLILILINTLAVLKPLLAANLFVREGHDHGTKFCLHTKVLRMSYIYSQR